MELVVVNVICKSSTPRSALSGTHSRRCALLQILTPSLHRKVQTVHVVKGTTREQLKINGTAE